MSADMIALGVFIAAMCGFAFFTGRDLKRISRDHGEAMRAITDDYRAGLEKLLSDRRRDFGIIKTVKLVGYDRLSPEDKNRWLEMVDKAYDDLVAEARDSDSV